MSSTLNTWSFLFDCGISVYKLQNNITLKILLSLTRIISCEFYLLWPHSNSILNTAVDKTIVKHAKSFLRYKIAQFVEEPRALANCEGK